MSESSQGGKFDSNLGGVAIRYGEVSGVIGVFDAPDTPMPIGMTLQSRADGRGPGAVPAPDRPGGSPGPVGVPHPAIRAGRSMSGAGGRAIR